MTYKFNSWEIDINLADTKKYYANNDDSIDKKINNRFLELLSDEQKQFFNQFGLDMLNVNVEYHKLAEETSDMEVKEIYDVTFLLCGKLLSISSFQADIYGAEDVFGKDSLKNVKVFPIDNIINSDTIDGMLISFKHPCMFFPEEKYEHWDCGFVLGKAILKK